jgi:CHASE2 domain-containing sensor protein/predicted Ser/Thr protein kinase
MQNGSSHSCPNESTWFAYARDDLDTTAAGPLDQHLISCLACRNRYLEALGQQLLVPDVPGCRVVKEIGRGRFGVVYKAWWMTAPGGPKVVALKVLHSIGEMERVRFEREIAVLKHLNAPGIVKCLASGGDREAAYFIMDYVQGVHFDEYLRTSQDDLTTRLGVFEGVSRAVAEAHKHGVIHRDLKPRNIIVDADRLPHVLDFGICSVDSQDWSSWARGTITHPGDVIGTLRYMSPEQAWGGVAGPIDERSDLWALGVMLHELVTDGDYPYSVEPTPDKSAHEALLERIRKDIPKLPRLDGLPRGCDLETLLERCLAWEPGERVASAQALADDIAAYRKGRRIKTRPLSLAYRAKRIAIGAATKSRWTFAAAFMAAVGVTLAVTSLLGGISWAQNGSIGHVSMPRLAAHQSGSKTPAGTANVRDAITIVGVSDDTIPAVEAWARQNQIDGVTANLPTWRGVHAHLMHRLVEAEPAALIWDFYFEDSQSADQDLVSGILALESAGVPVVLAYRTFMPDGRPYLSPNILTELDDRLRCGLIRARDMVRRPGEFVLAVRPGNAPRDTLLPGIWLSVYAALFAPEARLELDWPDRNAPLTMLYRISPDRYRREHHRVVVSRPFIGPGVSDEAGELGTTDEERGEPGDLVAFGKFAFEPPESWERRTVPYEQLLTMSQDELRHLTAGRLLIVGDLRTAQSGDAFDRHAVKYGSGVIHDVPGCYLVADAIAGLIQQQTYRVVAVPPLSLLALALGSALIGCVVPIRLARWRALESDLARRCLGAGLAGMAAISFMAMTWSQHQGMVYLAVALFALALSMAGSFWVEFARNRHRMAERKRRVIENFGLSSGGTLTLPPRQLRSIPEIR